MSAKNHSDATNPDQIIGPLPDIVNHDGSISDAIGVPRGYATKPFLGASRFDEEEAFAEEMLRRVQAYDRNHY